MQNINYIYCLFHQAAIFLIGQHQLANRILSYKPIVKVTSFNTKHRRELDHHRVNVTPKLTFPKNYHVKGVLKLPYGDIVEPFEAWYARDEKMSRIDYYGGNNIQNQLPRKVIATEP